MRKLAVLCLGLSMVTLLAGCGSDPDSTASDSVSKVAPAATPPGLREQAPSPADGRSQSTETSTRKEVVTGNVDITTADPIAAAATVSDRVRAAGGRVDSRTEHPGTEQRDPSATLTVRVPADKTDTFIDGLGGLGEITEVSTNRDDVTMQWEDLEAKIKALQASVDRLRILIAGATSTADLLAAENALSSRQGELDSLTAQKRRLDDQVALSDLTIDITATEKKADTAGPDNFWDGLVSGWNSLVDWLGDAIIFTGKVIPWLGFLAVLALIGWFIARLARPRRKSNRPAVISASGSGAGTAAQPVATESASGVAESAGTTESASVGAKAESGVAKSASSATGSAEGAAQHPEPAASDAGAGTSGTAKTPSAEGDTATAESAWTSAEPTDRDG